MDSRKMIGFRRTIIGVIILLSLIPGLSFSQDAEYYFQQGKADLENQLLVSAHNNFQSALASDPNHQGANLFFALIRILMISNSTEFNTLLNRAGVSSTGRDILNWTADFTRDPQGRIILPSDSPTGQELQNFLKNNILPEINGALNNNLPKVTSGFQTTFKFPIENGTGSVSSPNVLTDITQFWGYNEWVGYKIIVEGNEYTITSNTPNTLTVTPNWSISAGSYNYKIVETIEIDYGDVLVIKGSLTMAKAGIYILSAYNLNVDIDTIVSLYNAGTLNFQNHVINTYNQLLTLLPDQQLSQAKSILRDVISIFTSAIDFIIGEGDLQDDDLFIIETLEEEQEYRNLLTDLNNALDGTTYIRNFEQYVNLSQFFDYPKVLRNYLPTFRGMYFIQSGTFPDPTFGGILPYMTLRELDEKLISENIFSDVSWDYWAYNYIMAIYNAHITTGCSQNPLKYCPEDNVSRGQMAAFIIRAKYGENFTYTQTPYFSDVPSTHVFFKYVQKLKDVGITAVSGTYDVDSYVTRGQMAAFIIRSKYGENFSYTLTPYFTDVPGTHNFFKYVQKLKDEGITAVTGTYGVDNIVTRAQMAAFLARAFLGME